MNVLKFFYEILIELRMIKWPTNRELVNYSLVVFFVIIISSVIISVMDLGFSVAIDYLLGWE